jgi:hypothetical protein
MMLKKNAPASMYCSPVRFAGVPAARRRADSSGSSVVVMRRVDAPVRRR